MSPIYYATYLALSFTPDLRGTTVVGAHTPGTRWVVRDDCVVDTKAGTIVVPTMSYCRRSDPREICDALNRIYTASADRPVGLPEDERPAP